MSKDSVLQKQSGLTAKSAAGDYFYERILFFIENEAVKMPRTGGKTSAERMPAGKPVGAVLSALAILRYLGAQGSAVPGAQVARSLNLNPSTCFNVLKTLVAERLVHFDEAGKTYRLGLGMIELAGNALEQVGSLRQVHPELERLAAAWRVSMTAWLRVSDTRVVLVDRAQAPSTIQIHMRVGHRLPLLVGALGRCMAAYSGLSEDELRRQYAEIRQDHPVAFEQFLKEVAEVRETGFAVDRDGFERGITTVSSVVLDADGYPYLAISAIGLTAQCGGDTVASIGAELCATTRRLGATLSGTSARGRSLQSRHHEEAQATHGHL